jgi:hypothetical protein
MLRILIVCFVADAGALAGAALGTVLSRPPSPDPGVCGMWALPGMFLGGAIGAALMTWLGLRLTRRLS